MWFLIIFIFVIVVIFGVLGANYEADKKRERALALNQRLSEIEDFNVSKKVDGFGGFYIFAIDESNEKVALITETINHIINFSDIIGVELIEDGNTISKKSTTRTIGGAIVGGVLAGGAGTIVGGLSGNSIQKSLVSSLSVKILLRSLDMPSLIITCFDSRTMTTEHKASLETDGKLESYIYKIGKMNADDIKDLVSVIIDRTDTKVGAKPFTDVPKISTSIADELLKLNELKERGILTEDEFIMQKIKILN